MLVFRSGLASNKYSSLLGVAVTCLQLLSGPINGAPSEVLVSLPYAEMEGLRPFTLRLTLQRKHC